MRLHAHIDPEGIVRATWLVAKDDGLWLKVDVRDGDETGATREDDGEDRALPVPPGVIEGIFARYGKPLEEPVADSCWTGEKAGFISKPQSQIQNGSGSREKITASRGRDATNRKPGTGEQEPQPRPMLLRAFRYRGFGSVHDNDWLALEERDGADTLAVPAPLFTAALTALARAAAQKIRPPRIES